MSSSSSNTISVVPPSGEGEQELDEQQQQLLLQQLQQTLTKQETTTLQPLRVKYNRQVYYVQLIHDCRHKKELSRQDNIVLLKKYGFFLLEADNLLSDEQKLKKVLKILRSNPSTLIAALEELLPIEKELYERTGEKEDFEAKIDAIVKALQQDTASEQQDTQDGEETATDSSVTGGGGEHSPFSVNSTNGRVSGKFTPPPSPLLSTLSGAAGGSRKSLTSTLLGSSSHHQSSTHSNNSSAHTSMVANASTSSPPPPPPSPMPSPNTLTASELLQRLIKNVIQVLEMREESFAKDICGRSHSQDRNNILRDHIHAMNKILDSYALICKLNEKQARINLQTLYIEGLDFSSLCLKYVVFGNNKIKDCNFKHVTGLSVDPQMAFVQAFDAKFDEDFYQQLHAFKIDQYRKQLDDINEMIEECKNSLDCLLNFFLFACVKEFDVRITVQSLSLEDLRRTTFSLMNDQDINAIPEDEEMSYIWMNENRLQVFNKEREELCEMLERMLQARNFYLPEEVLSLSIDRKTYNFEEEISSSKIYMEDMQKNFIYLLPASASSSEDSTADSDPKAKEQREAVETLNQRILHIKERQGVILEERKLRRDENNIYRRNVYLGQLNAELDPVLKQGPTERLSEVMKLSRGKYEHAIVDLRFTDISQVDMEKIDFSQVYSQITPEQEKLYLTQANRYQRYTLLYEFARTGNIKDLDCLVTECELDINRQDERGTTALMHACIFKQEEMVKHLIEKYKAKHDIKTPTGWDVISTLCSVRDVDHPGQVDKTSRRIAEFLIEKAGAKISVHNATRINRLDLLKTFSKKELHSIDKATECSVAHIAARDNNVEILSYLFDVKYAFEQSQGMFGFLTGRGGGAHHNNASGATGADGSSINGEDQDEAEDAKPSALWVACENGCIEAAKLIITRCPRLKDKSYRHLTPVKIALRQGHMELVKVLKGLGVMIDVEIAVALQDKEWIVSYLNSLEAHLHPHGSSSSGSNKDDAHHHSHHQTPQQAAAAALTILQLEQRKKTELCNTLLHACKYRWITLVQDLIEVYNVDLNHRFEKEYRNRAVDIVCAQGDVALMSLLLEYAGTTSSTTTDAENHHLHPSSASTTASSTPATASSSAGGASSHMFDLNESYGNLCPSLIFTAISRKHWDCLRLILDKKPDLSRTYIGDKTALHAFLQATDDVSMTTSSSSTSSPSSPSSTAASSVMTSALRYEIVKQMIDQGASVLAIDAQGNTPLHYAARAGDEVAALILRAFIGVKNSEGKSAIDFADQAGNDITIFRAAD